MERKGRHIAIMPVSGLLFQELFQLPNGIEIIDIRYNQDQQIIEFFIGDRTKKILPVVVEGTVIPIAQPRYSILTQPNGKQTVQIDEIQLEHRHIVTNNIQFIKITKLGRTQQTQAKRLARAIQ